MKKSTPWIVLTLVLVFAAGVVGGVLGDRWWFTKRPQMRRPASAERYPSRDRWAKDLGLTSEQQEKIREIFKKNDERMRTDEKIKELRVESNKRFAEIREQLKNEIDAVLTPEQRVKNEAMIQKMMEERRKENEKRDKQSESQRNRNPKKETGNEKESSRRSGDPGGPRGGYPGLYPY
jgi:Spy/CpxP family protein refolding chaperone